MPLKYARYTHVWFFIVLTLKQGTLVGYRGRRNQGPLRWESWLSKFLLSELVVGQNIPLHVIHSDQSTAYSQPSRFIQLILFYLILVVAIHILFLPNNNDPSGLTGRKTSGPSLSLSLSLY